ncbi:MAG TPA: extracellular solute-binding protein [Anaerolineaceae bacterium]
MKPIRIFSSLILLVAFLLAACSGNSTPAPSPTMVLTPSAQPSMTPGLLPTRSSQTPTPAPSQGVKPESLKGIHITIWHPWIGETAALIANLASEYNDLNIWGIQIEARGFGGTGELFNQVNASLKEKKGPNLILTTPEQVNYWREKSQQILDLNDYVHHPDWGIPAQEILDFIPGFWESDQVNGERFGIPALRSVQVLFYNETWAKELGYANPPVTFSDFKTQACTAAKANQKLESKEMRGTGGWIIKMDPMSSLAWMAAFGGFPQSSKANEYHFDSAANIEAFTFLRSLYDEGCAWVSRVATPYEYFSSRMALFYSGTSTDLPIQVNAQGRLNSPDRWTVIPYPTVLGKPITLVSGYTYSIFRSTPEEQLAAWLFIRWMILSEQQTRLALSASMIPVSKTALGELKAVSVNFPQQAKTYDLATETIAAPGGASWRSIRRVVEDFTWSVFQSYTKPEDIPALIKNLDETAKDLAGKSTR